MLYVSDFDGTIAQTFVPSPHGIGVHEAYELTIEEIFGSDVLRFYRKGGGLKNRAPGEVIEQLLSDADDSQLEPLERTKRFLSEQENSLQSFVPMGKGASLRWNTSNPHSVITEILVRVKLRHFWKEIGSRFPDGRTWPEPCAGFVKFYQGLETTSNTLGIISSGNDLFIEKCFEVWEIPQPSLVVTDDLMRSPHCEHLRPLDRVKPGTGPFQMFQNEWTRKFGTQPPPLSDTVYVGDSLAMDGAMARNIGVNFVWFNPTGEGKTVDGMYSITDWRELETLFMK